MNPLIQEQLAKLRREELQQEVDLYRALKAARAERKTGAAQVRSTAREHRGSLIAQLLRALGVRP